MSNVIVRAVFNRPEMLFLSLESEIAARKYFVEDEYKTLFCVEHGAPGIILDVIDELYEDYDYEIIKRPYRHHGWGNILEGLKHAAEISDSYMLNLEDDCLLHKTYFKYLSEAEKLVDSSCAVINVSNRSNPDRDRDDVTSLFKGNRFEATCCLMYVEFFEKYVRQYATHSYYKNRAATIKTVNARAGNDPRLKYKNGNMTHVGWDGLANRLVDIAMIEEDMYTVSPSADRRMHIGFYGQNRPGVFPSMSTDFFARLDTLRKVIVDPQRMSKNSKLYSDYELFTSALDSWSGKLKLRS